jgi:endonuclease/exonuclease/phosphatase family metal-dependent hydrolase
MLPAPTPPLRVLSWNIRKGLGPHARRSTFADLEAVLGTQPVDLLLLQEVDHHWTDPQGHQSQRLASFLGLHAAYEPNKQRRGGHHGNATFSRHALQQIENIDLSVNRIERRGVLHVRLEVGTRALHVFNTHLGLTGRQRRGQVERIAAEIEARCPPEDAVLLAGDFNDFTGRLDRRVRLRCGLENALAGATGVRRRSWPSGRPLFALDRLYLRGLRLVKGRVLRGRPWSLLSDHLPLRARVAFADARV